MKVRILSCQQSEGIYCGICTGQSSAISVENDCPLSFVNGIQNNCSKPLSFAVVKCEVLYIFLTTVLSDLNKYYE